MTKLGITVGLVSPLILGTIAQLVKHGYGIIVLDVLVVVGVLVILTSAYYSAQARA